MKNFISGFLTATMLCATILTANAATEATIPVTFDAIRVVAEGININDMILYNGTTYVPLRRVGEIFNKEIQFDAESKTAYIGEVPKAGNSSIDNPVPMGVTEPIDVNKYSFEVISGNISKSITNINNN